MEGVTDAPMREWFARQGGFSYSVSEFLRVTQLVPPAHVYRDHIPELFSGSRTRSGLWVQVQLLGGDAGLLADSAYRAVELGACGVDLNFGCPAPVVNRHDGGAALLKFPHRIREIVSRVRAVVPADVPVSVKMRLGWDRMDSILENAEMAALGGASWITIHGRTKIQGYQPPAYWGPIGEVRKRLGGLPIVANGDIWTFEDFLRCRDETGCEHFMLGRSAMANPLLPRQIARDMGVSKSLLPNLGETIHLKGETEYSVWLPRLIEFASLMREYSPELPEKVVLNRLKQWIRMLHLRRDVDWFDRFKRLESLESAFSMGFEPATI
jgi:tRNA-dihydrouridine synthase C